MIHSEVTRLDMDQIPVVQDRPARDDAGKDQDEARGQGVFFRWQDAGGWTESHGGRGVLCRLAPRLSRRRGSDEEPSDQKPATPTACRPSTPTTLRANAKSPPSTSIKTASSTPPVSTASRRPFATFTAAPAPSSAAPPPKSGRPTTPTPPPPSRPPSRTATATKA